MTRSLEDLLRDILWDVPPEDDEVEKSGRRGPIWGGEFQIGCGGEADLIWLHVLRQLRAIGLDRTTPSMSRSRPTALR